MGNAPLKGQITSNAKLDFSRMRVLLKRKRVSNSNPALFPWIYILGIIIAYVEVAGNAPIVYKINIIKNLVKLTMPLAGNHPWPGGILLPCNYAERKRNKN